MGGERGVKVKEQVAEDTREWEGNDFPCFIRYAINTRGRGPRFEDTVVDGFRGGRGSGERGVLKKVVAVRGDPRGGKLAVAWGEGGPNRQPVSTEVAFFKGRKRVWEAIGCSNGRGFNEFREGTLSELLRLGEGLGVTEGFLSGLPGGMYRGRSRAGERVRERPVNVAFKIIDNGED